jgi:hypothetical protein
MDAQAAAFTAEELEKDLTKLADKRRQLIALNFIGQNSENSISPEGTAAFEEKLTLLENDVMRFMQSLFREMVQTTRGEDKDEQGNPIVRPTLSEEGKSIIKTTLPEGTLEEVFTKKPLEFEEYSVYA